MHRRARDDGMNLWNPEVWNGVGIVGFIIFVAVFHVWAYLRGWIVPGRYHQEIVGSLRAEIDRNHQRAATDGTTILEQQRALAEKNAGEQMAAHLLESVREIAEKRGSPT